MFIDVGECEHVTRKTFGNLWKSTIKGYIYNERCIVGKERSNSIQIFCSIISLNNLRESVELCANLKLCSICGPKVFSFCVLEKIPRIGDLGIWRSFVVTKINILKS